MHLLITRGTAVIDQQTIKAAIVRFSHRGVNAYICRDAANDQVPDALEPKQELEVCVRKSALARLIYHGLVLYWVELRNGVMSCFAPYQKAAKRTLVADAETRSVIPRTVQLSGGQVGKI